MPRNGALPLNRDGTPKPLPRHVQASLKAALEAAAAIPKLIKEEPRAVVEDKPVKKPKSTKGE